MSSEEVKAKLLSEGYMKFFEVHERKGVSWYAAKADGEIKIGGTGRTVEEAICNSRIVF